MAERQIDLSALRLSLRRIGGRGRFDVTFYSPQAGALLENKCDVAGGAEVQILMLAKGLARRGHKVALIVKGHPDRLPRELDGVRIRVHRPTRLRRRPQAGIEAALRAGLKLLAVRPRVYVQRNAGAETGIVRLTAWVVRARFVYSTANVIDFDYGKLEPLRRHVKAYELGARHADEIVVQTREQLVLCRERWDRDATLIPSISEARPLRHQRPEAFLWVGRAAFYKRPESFVELARALPEARFQMIMAPSGPTGEKDAAKLRAAARSLDNLELLAPRSREEVGELINTSVAVVNTSEYEGLSNVFLEAWARGVPALALHHDPDGLIEAEGLGGFAHGSPARLAGLAGEMWESRGDQRLVAQRCRAYLAARHAAGAVFDQWERVLGLASDEPLDRVSGPQALERIS